MKKIITVLLLIIVIVAFSGCGQKITLDNVDMIENDNEFSMIIMGRFIKQTDETKIVQDAKDFAKKFMTKNYTRSYKETLVFETESMIFTDEYKEKNENLIKETVEFSNEFYKTYSLETSVQNVNYKKVVNVGGDAYVKGIAKIRLLNCGDMDIANAIGYNEGLNSNLPCEFEIKMKYI